MALHLTRWAGDLGFDPILIEPREERITPAHRTAARVEPGLEGLDLTEDTSTVHTDHDAPDLVQALEAVLPRNPRFIGLVGSRRHTGHHLEALRAKGVADDVIARIQSPVGLDLGAVRPDEIALSILAGLVAHRRGRAGGWLQNRA